MTTTALRLATSTLLAGAVLALSACGTDDTAVELGPGIVTPGADGTATTTPAPSPSSTPAAEASPSPSASQSAGSGAAAVPPPFRDPEADVDAADQTGDGRSVRVAEVQLSRTAGFAAVYTRDQERLLGSAPVPRSSTDDQGVTVPLDEPLTATTELVVVLFADDGDGRFDPAQDPRVNGDDDGVELEVDRLTYRLR